MKKQISLVAILSLLLFSSCNLSEKNKIKDWCKDNNCTFEKINQVKDAYNFPWNDPVCISLSHEACDEYNEATRCYTYGMDEDGEYHSKMGDYDSKLLNERAKAYDGKKVIGKLVFATVSNDFHKSQLSAFVILEGNDSVMYMGSSVDYIESTISGQCEFDEMFGKREDEIFEKSSCNPKE